MTYSLYELLFFFLAYSVIGWAAGTVAAAVREKKFIDVGFLYGPYCPAYGIVAVLFAVFLSELKDRLVFLFLGGTVLSFIVTLGTGFVLERIFHRKWWDYSRRRFQFGGHVNIPYVILWGILAVVCVNIGNPLLMDFVRLFPRMVGEIVLLAAGIIILLDLIGTIVGILSLRLYIKKASVLYSVSESLQNVADTMGEGLTGWTLKHLNKAYPLLDARSLVKAKLDEEKRLEEAKERAGVFAVGCSFYKLVCLFFLGSFLGDITETIFCYVTAGELMSRSSVVYGPFSIVWGFGCVLLTAILYQYRTRSDGYIFLFGTVLGGAYEYFCSVFTELVFGTVFWDYSKIPFNLGGRINLLYCFFWGIAAVVWLKVLYPLFSGWIEKIPKKAGIVLTWIMIVFMIFNMTVSAFAMARYSVRNATGAEAETTLDIFMDEHFPDERMERIYPNAIIVEDF
ncbi:MAG: putative ABC transporter permease [Frisingicoccus sp.]|uniref:putative ABC transporter permease n=2 Tax=Frisingicoccus sp. TaxID=1918627 RepID=UPI002A81FA19|nr:putative ABC transporter permease [Frisingicoccus sp.]MDY4834149.1 putative ABC transporter permease [Frisingicoccus sp.]